MEWVNERAAITGWKKLLKTGLIITKICNSLISNITNNYE